MFVFSVLDWNYRSMEANAGESFQMQMIFNIFPRISLHCKLFPVQSWEYEYGLLQHNNWVKFPDFFIIVLSTNMAAMTSKFDWENALIELFDDNSTWSCSNSQCNSFILSQRGSSFLLFIAGQK